MVGFLPLETLIPVLLLLAAGDSGDAFCTIGKGQMKELRQGQILIELREVEGSAAKEWCAIGLVDAEPEAVFAVIKDAERFEEFMPKVLESAVEVVDERTYLNTQKLDLPFPVKNRRYTIRVQSSVGEGKEGRFWRASWTYVKGSGNVKENYGSWTVGESEPGQTLVFYQVLSDPGGIIPKWVLNRATTHTLPNVMRALRERVKEVAKERSR